MPSYGLLTNPSNEILDEITNIHDLNFEYVEMGIEGPEGNPLIIEKKKNEILNLLQKFKEKPIGHTAYWIDLCSDYEYVRSAWIQEAHERNWNSKNDRHRSHKLSCKSKWHVLWRKTEGFVG